MSEHDTTSHDPDLTAQSISASVYRNRSFWGMLFTQFLGAFNDNVFKQMVLLICVDYVKQLGLKSDPYQPVATFLFALPFLLFSGLAGFLSDRFSKRSVVYLSKVAEIVIMAAGMVAFFVAAPGSSLLINLLIAILFFMGMQSAFFGPAKYGILPEFLKDRELPTANGLIQMTTFLAIILGMALSGVLKEWLGASVWIVSGVCIFLAIIGTATSLMIQKQPAANPQLKFDPWCLLVEKQAWHSIVRDRLLITVLVVYAVFWFAGGVILPVVNYVGKEQLNVGDSVTSLLSTCLALGIAIGCVISAGLCRGRIQFWVVKLGGIGAAIGLVVASIVVVLNLSISLRCWLLAPTLALIGIFSGVFAVPLQVFIQARPKPELKGRVIGAMNLITWVGIIFASIFYFICSEGFAKANLEMSWTFAATGILMLIVTLLFRPKPEREAQNS
jgi:MFS family permease